MSARSVLLISSIVSMAACTAKNDAAESSATTRAPNVVALSADEYTVTAPDTIPAGWTTFRLANHGEEIHYGHMVRLDSGKTVQQMVEAYAEAIRTSGPRPKWVLRFGGPGGAVPGDSSNSTQYLEPGSYVWICPVEDNSGTPHFAKGEFKPFVVHGASTSDADRTAAPAATAAVRLMDFSFALDSPLQSGRHTIRVQNTGVEPHDLVLMKLAPGRTVEDVLNALNPERARRPDQAGKPVPSLDSVGSVAGGIAVIAQGMESFFETNLTPGEYAMVCMTTAPDGRSHIEHGMIQQVTVR